MHETQSISMFRMKTVIHNHMYDFILCCPCQFFIYTAAHGIEIKQENTSAAPISSISVAASTTTNSTHLKGSIQYSRSSQENNERSSPHSKSVTSTSSPETTLTELKPSPAKRTAAFDESSQYSTTNPSSIQLTHHTLLPAIALRTDTPTFNASEQTRHAASANRLMRDSPNNSQLTSSLYTHLNVVSNNHGVYLHDNGYRQYHSVPSTYCEDPFQSSHHQHQQQPKSDHFVVPVTSNPTQKQGSEGRNKCIIYKCDLARTFESRTLTFTYFICTDWLATNCHFVYSDFPLSVRITVTCAFFLYLQSLQDLLLALKKKKPKNFPTIYNIAFDRIRRSDCVTSVY